jgi:hypothetical protein
MAIGVTVTIVNSPFVFDKIATGCPSAGYPWLAAQGSPTAERLNNRGLRESVWALPEIIEPLRGTSETACIHG